MIFLLVGPPCLSLCTGQVELFLRFMQQIGVPLKQEKTVYPTTMLTFLGLELDTNDMEIRLPMEKLQKNRENFHCTNKGKRSLNRNFNHV